MGIRPLDATMRRTRSAPLTLLAFAMLGLAFSLPVLARTSPLMAADGDAAECPDVAAADVAASGAAPASKPAAAKRGAAPAAGKPRPTGRGNAPAPVRDSRWHRFLPGMFR
jgi:hypothetical protein